MLRLLSLAALAAVIAGCASAPPPAATPPSAATSAAAPASAPAAATGEADFEQMAEQMHSPRLMAMVLLHQARQKKDADRAVLAAMFAARAGDYDLASQASALAHRLAPDQPTPYIADVKIALDQGDIDAAREAAAKAYGSGGAAAVQVALSGPVDPWFAYAVVSPLAKSHPRDSLLAMVFAESSLDAGDAHAALTAASAAGTDTPSATVLQAQAMWDLGRHTEALAKASAAVAGASHNIGLRVFYAGLLVHARRFDQAREVLDDAQALAPDNTHVQLAYATLDSAEGDFAKARGRITLLLETGSESAGAYNLLGNIAASRQEWGEAFGWYQGIDDDDFVASAQVAAAFALAQWQGPDAAQDYLDKLSTAFPALDPTWRGARASLLQQAGKRDEAYQLLATAVKRYPMVQDLRYQQAVLADELGKSEVALGLLHGLLQEQPDNAEYLNAYGYTLTERTTRYREAYGYIVRALAADPDNGAYLDSMGWVLYRLGESTKAVPYLRSAWAITGDSEVAQHLVTVYLALGEQSEAAKVLADALAKNPNDPQLLKLKRQLGPAPH